VEKCDRFTNRQLHAWEPMHGDRCMGTNAREPMHGTYLLVMFVVLLAKCLKQLTNTRTPYALACTHDGRTPCISQQTGYSG